MSTKQFQQFLEETKKKQAALAKSRANLEVQMGKGMSAKELEALTAKQRKEALGVDPHQKKNNAFIEKSLKRGQDLLGKIE